MPKKYGKIIRIVDSRTVIINLGKDDGINDQSIFNIYAKPEEIVDPETKKTLGSVILIKGKIKAQQVFDKFTIATSRWTENLINLSSWVSQPFKIDTKIRDEGELRVVPEEVQPWKATSEEPVRVGDIVEVEVSEIKKPREKDSSEN